VEANALRQKTTRSKGLGAYLPINFHIFKGEGKKTQCSMKWGETEVGRRPLKERRETTIEDWTRKEKNCRTTRAETQFAIVVESTGDNWPVGEGVLLFKGGFGAAARTDEEPGTGTSRTSTDVSVRERRSVRGGEKWTIFEKM